MEVVCQPLRGMCAIHHFTPPSPLITHVMIRRNSNHMLYEPVVEPQGIRPSSGEQLPPHFLSCDLTCTAVCRAARLIPLCAVGFAFTPLSGQNNQSELGHVFTKPWCSYFLGVIYFWT